MMEMQVLLWVHMMSLCHSDGFTHIILWTTLPLTLAECVTYLAYHMNIVDAPLQI